MHSASSLRMMATIAVFLMVGGSMTPLAASFHPQVVTSAVTYASRRRGSTAPSSPTSPLSAIVEPPKSPSGYVEDEKNKRKKTNESDDDDWTETNKGGRGFLPNILRRRNNKRPKHGRDVVRRIDNIPEYKAAVVDEGERITVVRFYAPWCKTCRAAESLFYRLAAEYGQPSTDQGVQFVEVPVTKDNAVLHEALGVPSLPWMHIYHPDAGLVEERKGSKAHFEAVARCLQCYIRGECDMADESCCSLL